VLVGIRAVKGRGLADLLHASRVETGAGGVHLGTPLAFLVAGELDLDQFVVEQGAVELGEYRFAQPGRACLHDRLEMMGLLLERAACRGIEG